MKMDSINISLPQPMADFVRGVVERDYGNASEYFRELVRLDQKRKEQERQERAYLETLREEVRIGLEAMKAGQFTDYNSADELISDIQREGQKRLAQNKNGHQ